jgi:hypothetical protein
MRRRLLLIAAGGAVCAVPAAAAAPAIDADAMTVSGRFAVTRADATVIHGRLRPKGAVAAALPAMLDWKPDAFGAAFDKAAAKSVANFGYGAETDATSAWPVTIELRSVEIEHQDKATVARVRLRLRADSGPDGCLTQEASGQFTALRPVRAGDGQRAFAVAATVALFAGEAAAGIVPSGPNTFLQDSFDTATAKAEAINAGRVTGQGEAVAPDRSDRGAARFAVINAIQQGVASLIDHLGQTDACRHQAAP